MVNFICKKWSILLDNQQSLAFTKKSSPFVTTVSIAVITSFFLLIVVFLTFTIVFILLSLFGCQSLCYNADGDESINKFFINCVDSTG